MNLVVVCLVIAYWMCGVMLAVCRLLRNVFVLFVAILVDLCFWFKFDFGMRWCVMIVCDCSFTCWLVLFTRLVCLLFVLL